MKFIKGVVFGVTMVIMASLSYVAYRVLTDEELYRRFRSYLDRVRRKE